MLEYCTTQRKESMKYKLPFKSQNSEVKLMYVTATHPDLHYIEHQIFLKDSEYILSPCLSVCQREREHPKVRIHKLLGHIYEQLWGLHDHNWHPLFTQGRLQRQKHLDD